MVWPVGCSRFGGGGVCGEADGGLCPPPMRSGASAEWSSGTFAIANAASPPC